ncbi:putative REJ domain-containing protein [Helianthus anomalus]
MCLRCTRAATRAGLITSWYLRSFGSENLVPVPRTICSSLTTGFIRTTSLP